jgi:capsid portal protein
MEKLQIINLSNYIRPEIKEVSGKKWVLNGDKNSFYQTIIDAYNGSPTNSAIIDSYSQFIYGKGLTSDEKAKKPSEWASVLSLVSKKDLRKICKDFEMFGEASIEVKYINNKIQRCFHIAKQRIAPEVANEEGDITGYYYSYDFSNVNKYKPERFDAFGFGDGLGERSEIYIFRDYQVGQFYYSNPSYVSGISWAKMEEEISNYSINHIQKGLSFGHIINMNCGVQESVETIQENTRQIRNHLTGSQNAGAFFLNWNDNKDSEITISALEVSEAHQQYAYLSAEARQQLCTSHKLTSPMLVGIKEANGFSSNAEEIKVGFAELMINVIKPKQEIILDGLMEVFAVNGITLDLQFESLRSEEPIITETTTIVETPAIAQTTQLSSQDFTDLGEDIDLNEWELISSEPVDYDKEAELDAEIERLNGFTTKLMKVALDSVSTGVARPNASSYQDGALFKSRYRYSGNPNPEREFCKKMINANKLYRKEDIEMMSQKNVNPGFGMHPNPDQPYDIFLWKGGGLLSDAFPFGTCKHFWVRETYRKRADVNNPNAEIITPAVARKEGEILPTNNPKAYIAPHDM